MEPTTEPPRPAEGSLAATRLPAWPGPVLTIAGFALAVAALATREIARALEVDAPGSQAALLALAAVGGIVLATGLTYALIRQLRRRRRLPARRYRGASVVLMLALALVVAGAAAVPFGDDATALIDGTGDVSAIGALVLATSTQLALLLVTWLFVFFPGVLRLSSMVGGGALRALAIGIIWGVPAWLVGSALFLAITLLLERAGLAPTYDVAQQLINELDPWLVVLAVVVLAPIAEEVFFRGVAFNAWLRERGPRFAYIGSATLFAAIHASVLSLVPIFLLGLALASVYRRTGSLLAPIALHATFNGITVALAMLVRFEVIRVPT